MTKKGSGGMKRWLLKGHCQEKVFFDVVMRVENGGGVIFCGGRERVKTKIVSGRLSNEHIGYLLLVIFVIMFA